MSKKTRAELVETLEMSLRTDHWNFDKHYVTHSCGIKIWIANGWVGLQIEEPTKINLSFIDQRRVYLAVKIAKDNFLIRELNSNHVIQKVATERKFKS